MILKEGWLKLVSTTPDDPEVQQLAQDYQILKNLSETKIHPQPMPSRWCFRIEQDNKLIGEIRLQNIKWLNRKAEISLFLAGDEQGKGVGTTVLRILINFAFQNLNLFRLEAEVADYNEGGKQLFEKMGFVTEGRLRQAKYVNGQYHDIIRYGLLKPEYE